MILPKRTLDELDFYKINMGICDILRMYDEIELVYKKKSFWRKRRREFIKIERSRTRDKNDSDTFWHTENKEFFELRKQLRSWATGSEVTPGGGPGGPGEPKNHGEKEDDCVYNTVYINNNDKVVSFGK